MPQDLTILTCAIAILFGGIVSGIFFAFSDFIMKSLATIPPASAVDAMTEINRKVYRSIFIVGIWSVALLSAVLIYAGALHTHSPASTWLIAGGAIYIAGVIAVSFLFNIPMNHKLESAASSSTQSPNYWNSYRTNWTRWNHVRSGSAATSTLCFLVAIYALYAY
jgi:uncharacterized membrane protein